MATAEVLFLVALAGTLGKVKVSWRIGSGAQIEEVASDMSTQIEITEAPEQCCLRNFCSDGNLSVGCLAQEPLATCGHGAREMWLVGLRAEFSSLSNFHYN